MPRASGAGQLFYQARLANAASPQSPSPHPFRSSVWRRAAKGRAPSAPQCSFGGGWLNPLAQRAIGCPSLLPLTLISGKPQNLRALSGLIGCSITKCCRARLTWARRRKPHRQSWCIRSVSCAPVHKARPLVTPVALPAHLLQGGLRQRRLGCPVRRHLRGPAAVKKRQ
jgi:hypothetical protein